MDGKPGVRDAADGPPWGARITGKHYSAGIVDDPVAHGEGAQERAVEGRAEARTDRVRCGHDRYAFPKAPTRVVAYVDRPPEALEERVRRLLSKLQDLLPAGLPELGLRFTTMGDPGGDRACPAAVVMEHGRPGAVLFIHPVMDHLEPEEQEATIRHELLHLSTHPMRLHFASVVESVVEDKGIRDMLLAQVEAEEERAVEELTAVTGRLYAILDATAAANRDLMDAVERAQADRDSEARGRDEAVRALGAKLEEAEATIRRQVRLLQRKGGNGGKGGKGGKPPGPKRGK